MDLKPNFTPRAQEIIAASRKLALSYNKRVVNDDHLCLALAKVDNQSLETLFNAFEVERKSLILFISKKLKKNSVAPVKKNYFSGEYKSILGGAVLEAEKHEHDYIGVQHILLSIFKKQENTISEFFLKEGVSLESCILTIRSQFLISATETLESSRLSSESNYIPKTEEEFKDGLKSNFFHCMNTKAPTTCQYNL